MSSQRTFLCNRTLDVDHLYDRKLPDGAAGRLAVTPSSNVRLIAVRLRRLFKTTNIDFDVPLAIFVTVEDKEGHPLTWTTLDEKESAEPARQLYEGLREAARRFYGLGVVTPPDAIASRALRWLLPIFTSGECTPTDVELIGKAFDDPGSLKDAPLDDGGSLRTVPLSDGHWVECHFDSPVLLEAGKSYQFVVTTHRRGWYKRLQIESESVTCEGFDSDVIIKFDPVDELSVVANALLGGLVFERCE